MASFSASDAALTGFRIVRERPKAVAIWAAIQFVVSLGSGLIMVSIAGPALTSLNAGGAAASRDPAAAMAVFQQLAPFYLFLLLFVLVFYPILYAAMNRAVLRPGDEGFGYLRLGADELRQLGLMLLEIGIGLLAYIALIIAIVAIAAPVGMAFRAQGGAGAGVGAVLLTVVLALGAIGLWIYVWVRLSLASALTFATRKVNLFGSWGLTKGLFWPIFGAYLVAFVLVIIVLLLTGVITFALSAAVGGGLASLMRPDLNSIGAFFTPARLINLVISSVAYALLWPVMLTPPAAIYKSLPGSVSEIDAAAAFD